MLAERQRFELQVYPSDFHSNLAKFSTDGRSPSPAMSVFATEANASQLALGVSMPRRPAKVTQADIARAIRAAREAGGSEVTVDADGVIRIVLTTSTMPIRPTNGRDQEWTPSGALQRFLKRTESG